MVVRKLERGNKMIEVKLTLQQLSELVYNVSGGEEFIAEFEKQARIEASKIGELIKSKLNNEEKKRIKEFLLAVDDLLDIVLDKAVQE